MLRQGEGLSGRQNLIERVGGMRIEIILRQPDGLRLRTAAGEQRLHEVGIVTRVRVRTSP